jgi:amino acid transporter
VSRSGGAYAYVEEAFGPFVGFIASILFWFGFQALTDAAITVVMVDAMTVLLPGLGDTVPRAAFIVTLLAFLAAVNVRGVGAGVRLYVLNTLVKLVPLLLLLGAGLLAINLEPSAASVGAGTILLFYAFNGAESALSASGEIENPAKTVPLGLLCGLGGILLLHAGLQTVAQGVLGPELAENTEAPLVAAATAVFGDWGGKMLIAAVVISVYSTLSGDLLGGPRVIFASALDDNLPKFLARVHPACKTPHVAIVFYAAVVGVFALTGTFKYLAVVAPVPCCSWTSGSFSPCRVCAGVTDCPRTGSSGCHSDPWFRRSVAPSSAGCSCRCRSVKPPPSPRWPLSALPSTQSAPSFAVVERIEKTLELACSANELEASASRMRCLAPRPSSGRNR